MATIHLNRRESKQWLEDQKNHDLASLLETVTELLNSVLNAIHVVQTQTSTLLSRQEQIVSQQSDQLNAALDALEARLTAVTVSEQAEDAAAAQVASDLADARVEIQGLRDQLAAATTPAETTALTDRIGLLTQRIADLEASPNTNT